MLKDNKIDALLALIGAAMYLEFLVYGFAFYIVNLKLFDTKTLHAQVLLMITIDKK